MKTLNVELTKREIATIITALEYQHRMSLGIEKNPLNHLPSVVKSVKDRNNIIMELAPKLRAMLE
ncbi:MAG: hypothetical protein IJH63_04515 [Methanobrevibacter sp.]|nr:hypothetical protein [Methanobrevibacter sp.]